MDIEHTPDEGVTPADPAAGDPAADVPGDAVPPTDAAAEGAAEAAPEPSVEPAGDAAVTPSEAVPADVPVAADPVEPGVEATVPTEPIDAGVLPEPPDGAAAEVTADGAAIAAAEGASEVAAADGTADAAAAGATGKGVKPLLAVGGVVVAAAVVVGGIWFVQNARGSADEALRAIPANMEFVAGLDLLAFDDTEGVDRAIAAFSDELTEALEVDEPVETLDDLLDAIEGSIAEESDIDLEEDVYPWMGRSFAFGMRDLASADDAEVPPLIIAASVRDEDAARTFIFDELPGHIEAAGDPAPTVITSEQGDILSLGPEDETPMLLSVREGLLIAAPSQELIDEATLTAAGGESITSVDEFNAATTEVIDQGLWMYFDLEAASDAVAESAEMEGVALGGFVAAGVGMTPSGIAVDVAARIEATEEGEEVDPAEGFLFQLAPESSFRDGLPTGTVAYYGLPLDGEQSISGRFSEMDPEEYETLLEQFSSGDPMLADLIESLFDTLTGTFEFAMVPGGAQMLIPIDAGFALALGVVDQAAGESLVDDLVGLASGFGVSLEPGDDVSQITIEGFPLGALAVTDDRIIIGTSEDAVTPATGDRMVDDELYQRLDTELPGEGLVLYLDVAGLVDVIGDESGDFDVFEAVAGSATQNEDRFTAHLLVTFAEQPADEDANR